MDKTLDGIVIVRPEPTGKKPQNLCLDAGYVGSKEGVESRGYTAHIRPRGEEKKEIESNPNFKARRWVVEVTHSFFNRFRKLLVRFEKKEKNYLSLIHFACAIIVWRKFSIVHKKFTDRLLVLLEIIFPTNKSEASAFFEQKATSILGLMLFPNFLGFVTHIWHLSFPI